MIAVVGTTMIAQITGHESINNTAERFGIHATDLGLMWDDGTGRILTVFGDTYGEGWGGDGAGPSDADWRCNVLAHSTNTDLDRGLLLDSVVAREDGFAAQLLGREPERQREATVIPNSGIAVEGTQYLHYMSVREWTGPGRWITNYGGIASSTDGGRSWTKSGRARWINRAERDHPFQVCAFAAAEGHVHLLGTPNGRFGDARLGRVPAADLLEPSAYEYWTGEAWRPRDPFRATPVFGAPVGELSVLYSDHFGCWLASYLDEGRAAIVLRTAPELTGPWAEPQVLASGADHPALYGGYLHPASAHGPALYWAMSRWGPYNVYLMRSELTGT